MRKEEKARLKIGVTGGIGSGKTSVCRVFTVLGIPVFSTDNVARDIIDNDLGIRQRINAIAGEDLFPEENLDRKLLAKIIFNDSSLLKKVNSIIHPIVFDRFKKWELDQTAPYIIMESAIIFESGASKVLDKIITIVAPIEERVKRIICRNRFSREQAFERIDNQMDDSSRVNLSDYVISNSENDMIIPDILKIHNEILNFCNSDN
jgi:dephospho-CoA kinase